MSEAVSVPVFKHLQREEERHVPGFWVLSVLIEVLYNNGCSVCDA